jgi:hypothetical protein
MSLAAGLQSRPGRMTPTLRIRDEAETGTKRSLKSQAISRGSSLGEGTRASKDDLQEKGKSLLVALKRQKLIHLWPSKRSMRSAFAKFPPRPTCFINSAGVLLEQENASVELGLQKSSRSEELAATLEPL